MSKIKVAILGGGVSGLTIAHALSKHQDRFQVELIEQSNRLGGWIDTDTSTGFVFEKGPRVFLRSRSADLMPLIDEIGLGQEIIEPGPEGSGKYVLLGGRLRKTPALSWNLMKGLVKDWKCSPGVREDESVWDFACRHFNPAVAAQIFDPLVVGICGGDSRDISVTSCLPIFKAIEEQHGSIVKGMLKREKTKGSRLFGFSRGAKSIIQKLVEKTSIPLHLNESVLSIRKTPEGFEVRTSKNVYNPHYLFSALPAPAIGKLLVPELLQIPLAGATIVHLGYSKKVLSKKGFGYLVPSHEKEDLLGVVFDSNAFSQHNHHKEETRLAVMLKGGKTDSEARSSALKVLAKHLQITCSPEVSLVMQAPAVFPQFLVGHKNRMEALEKEIEDRFPRLQLAGNYLYGSSVNDCVARARSVVDRFLQNTIA